MFSMKNKHLTAADRKAVEVLLHKDCSRSEIAKELGVDRSTVCREVNYRSTPMGYFSDMAQVNYESRRRSCGKKRGLSQSSIQGWVIARLKAGYSPEQISGRMRLEKRKDYICKETIYDFIYTDPYCKREKLYQYLRQGKKKRTKHYGRKTQRIKIPNRVSIRLRPRVVEERIEFGHWEGDSVLYPDLKVINTLNELFSGLVRFKKLERRTTRLTTRAMIYSLKDYQARTLTLDNGLEFVNHEKVTQKLGVKIFFCDPYSSYQRGSNENTNMLLRRYLPKKTDISNLTQQELNDIANELNNRPRKRLGFLTPLEFYEQKVLNTKRGATVAVESRM